jgi:hypothetical protein
MLWYKSWLETRWRFLIGLALLLISACGTVLGYPQVLKLLPLAAKLDLGGEIGRRVAEAAELARTYRGYVFAHWFRQNLAQSWTIFAVLLGTGGLLSQSSGGGGLFTLSLPVSRNRLLGIRAATGLVELLILAFIPSLVLPVLSPAIGQSYSVGDVLVHGTCLFIAGAVFYSFAFLLSTIFSDVWRPLLIALCLAMALAMVEQFGHLPARISLIQIMTAEVWFRGNGLPWLGLLLSAALSAVLLFAANRNLVRQDF